MLGFVRQEECKMEEEEEEDEEEADGEDGEDRTWR